MRRVEIWLEDTEEERVRKILFWHAQREDCAEWDGNIPIISCDIPESCIMGDIIQWVKNDLTINIFVNSRSRTITFNSNGAKVL